MKYLLNKNGTEKKGQISWNGKVVNRNIRQKFKEEEQWNQHFVVNTKFPTFETAHTHLSNIIYEISAENPEDRGQIFEAKVVE